ncbi:hypothetical protein KY290_028034 [Solanum tuberosum]|uniref:Uncharacterized protein n=1 Tax=Solanum tuberosum TaxID=4113 RepID=A0ABQ7UGS8_SOLTU|nr:hypothetical protein KY290_028034 [Solanum tuberosum]
MLLCQAAKPVSIQRSDDVVPKITAIPVPATCSMDISPSHSDGSLISMDESMSTSDTVRSPKLIPLRRRRVAPSTSQNMSKQQLFAREMYLWTWNQGIKLSTLINYVLQWDCEAYASRGYIAVAIDSRYHGHQYDNISKYEEICAPQEEESDNTYFKKEVLQMESRRGQGALRHDASRRAGGPCFKVGQGRCLEAGGAWCLEAGGGPLGTTPRDRWWELRGRDELPQNLYMTN